MLTVHRSRFVNIKLSNSAIRSLVNVTYLRKSEECDQLRSLHSQADKPDVILVGRIALLYILAKVTYVDVVL